MSDAEAKSLFDEAITALKTKKVQEACGVLERIIKRAPAGSLWHAKAASLAEKRCGS
jgi:hypothetical protein